MRTPLLTGPLTVEGPFPSQTRRLRLAIVGGGGIGRVHAWAAALSERWEVVGVAPSSDPARVQAASDNMVWRDCEIFSSHVALIEAARARTTPIDAVAITVPNHLHYDVATACLDAGLNVMCEKPLTIYARDAADLVMRAADAEVSFCAGYPYAAFPMVRQARSLIASGALGGVRQIHAEFVQDYLLTQAPASVGSWRHDPARAGAGSSADIGTHAFHLAEFVTGLAIEQVRGEFYVSGPSRPIEDTFFAFVRAQSGVLGILWGSQAAAGITSGPRVRIICERASLDWNNGFPQELHCHWIDQPAQIFTRGRGRGLSPAAERFTRRPRGNTEGWVEAWANLYTEFALAIAARADGISVPDGVLDYPGVVDGARGVAFVEAMIASVKRGGAWTAV